jgi:hypothetical protein
MTDRTIPSEPAEKDKQELPGESSLCEELSEQNQQAGMTRREMMKIAAGAAVAAPLLGVTKAQAAAKPVEVVSTDEKTLLFFTPQEFALVDELAELIIPADEHSPGARAAQVAAYIDARLAESFTDEPKQVWRNGLKLIDSISQEMHSKAFLQATPEQRIALLTRISRNEANPQKPEELFFGELKGRTVRGYYTSKIGIHDEMEYKGNTYQKEYAGYDAK